MRRRAAVWLAWVILAASLTLMALVVVRAPSSPGDGSLFMVPLVAFATVGAIVAARRPDHPIGWLFSAIGLLFAFSGSVAPPEGVVGTIDPAWWAAADTVGAVAWYLALGMALTFALLLFPTGRLPSRRWRPVAWLAVLGIIAIGAGDQLRMSREGQLTLVSALGLTMSDPGAITLVLASGTLVLAVAVIGSAASLIVRFQYARGQERQQLKWFAAAAGLAATAAVVVFVDEILPDVAGVTLGPVMEIFGPLAIATIPIAAGLAILRYRLYDIDIIINRALVYSLLTAVLAALYFGGVVLVQGILRAVTGQESDLAIVASTLAVAVCFQPLRHRVQRFIDRRFYRQKYDAARILAAHGAVVRDEVDIDHLTVALVQAATETLRPAQASLWLRSPEERR